MVDGPKLEGGLPDLAHCSKARHSIRNRTILLHKGFVKTTTSTKPLIWDARTS